jgi:hypothetical protein
VSPGDSESPPPADRPLDAVTRREVFDPALRHLDSALVDGDPVFRGPDARAAFYQTRRLLIAAAQRAIAASASCDRYVLRGSVCLSAWFGDRARRPKDLDLVVRPADILPSDPRGLALLETLRSDVAREVRATGVSFIEDRVRTESIWTYERAEGRRLLFPWRPAPETDDWLQIDVVYCEPLVTEPVRHEDESGAVWFASREEQLAWKILWLFTDSYPQGKDLYDAVLLAESTPLSRRLLRAVFDGKNERWDARLDDDAFVRDLAIDWPNFALDYPELASGTGEAWKDRLAQALRLVA